MSRIRRTGALAELKPVCGACAIRKRPTCVGPETTPSRSGASAFRSEIRPVAADDWSTNAMIERRSSARPAAGSWGKRRNAATPTAPTASVLTTCAATIAAIVSEIP